MFKQLILFLISIVTLSVIADETAIITLKNRFDKINNLYAHFIQKIYNIDGNILEECTGELWIKRPNFFYWHMKYPEENFLIFDGTSLWFYIPIINQVIVYSDKIFADNFFLALIFTKNISIWNKYNIFQQEDYFFLKLVCGNIDIQECKIKITDCGLLEQCNVLGSNGERIDYYLSKHDNQEININHFFFNLPVGVQLDDQR